MPARGSRNLRGRNAGAPGAGAPGAVRPAPQPDRLLAGASREPREERGIVVVGSDRQGLRIPAADQHGVERTAVLEPQVHEQPAVPVAIVTPDGVADPPALDLSFRVGGCLASVALDTSIDLRRVDPDQPALPEPTPELHGVTVHHAHHSGLTGPPRQSRPRHGLRVHGVLAAAREEHGAKTDEGGDRSGNVALHGSVRQAGPREARQGREPS